jgi:hypothetical protein
MAEAHLPEMHYPYSFDKHDRTFLVPKNSMNLNEIQQRSSSGSRNKNLPLLCNEKEREQN